MGCILPSGSAEQSSSAIIIFMKGYEPSMVGRVHHNVQTMLAQARLILKPTPSLLALKPSPTLLPPLKRSSFLEVPLPTTKALNPFKATLTEASHDYSRRELRRPLTKLQQAELTSKARKTRSRNQLSTLCTNNSRLRREDFQDNPILATFESELLDLDRSSLMRKGRDSLSAARDKQPRYYLTISNEDIHAHPPPPPRKKRKRLKSLLLPSERQSRACFSPVQQCSPWETEQAGCE